MLKLRTLHALAALCSGILLSVNIGGVPARASAPAHSAPIAKASTHLRREVFGFAFGNSSLADRTYGYAAWRLNLLSTIAYFGLDVSSSGAIVQAGAGWTTWNSSTLTGLVSAAHGAGARVIVSIDLHDFSGAPGGPMCTALAPAHRAVTVAQTVAQVQRMRVDGVNLDYEGLNGGCANGATTRAEYTSLVAEMRAALPGAYLAVDTYAGAAADPWNFFDVPGIAPHVDSLFVMAYDMEYSNDHHAPLSCPQLQYLNCLGPTSPLSGYYYNDTTVMAQYVSAAGAGKVLLGVPYYGRKSCVASATHNAVPTSAVVADDYLSASQEYTDSAVRPGSYATHRDVYDGTERWDTWYNTSLGCTRELYWDDAYSLGKKYDLVDRDGLRGVGIFALQYGGGAPELWNLLETHFADSGASYDLSQAPLGWQPGGTRTFNVTVTNRSSSTWSATGPNYTALDIHFTTAAGGSAYINSWLTSSVFRLPADLAPGQSAAIRVTITAPQRTGAMALEAEMFRNQMYWFTTQKAISVRIAKVLWFGTYDLSGAPASWRLGQTQSFTVTVKNAGNQTWPASGPNAVQLDLNFAPTSQGSAAIGTWISSRVFRLSADVAPGGVAAIPVTVTAPTAPGMVYIEAQLFKNQQFWFDGWQPVAVNVAGAWSASYGISGVPASWTPGQTQAFTVLVTNTGSQTWPAAGASYVALDMHFSSMPGGAAAIGSWRTSQVYRLTADVAPGQTAQIPMKVTAPVASGTTYLEAEMFQNQKRWFADAQPVAVTVGGASWSGGFDLSGVPAKWSAGQTQWFTVVVKNTGTSTWPAAGGNYVALDMHFANRAGESPAAWLTSQVFRLTANVAPGQTAQIPVRVTAPAQGGSLLLEASMFKNQQAWFPNAQPVAVQVAPATWWASGDLGAVPTAWGAGQTQRFTISVRNTGNELWPATGPNPVELNLRFATSPSGAWLGSRSFVLPVVIAPGDVAQIAVAVTAPTQPGTYYLQAQMFKNQQMWILPMQPVAVTVG
jgi:glycosyl hydrolase family 18 (putative chitinase)